MTTPETDVPETAATDAPTSPSLPAVFAGFAGPDAPAEADMYRCVHCGLCLSSCPTYTVTGLEMESPRGRIALMKAVNEGRVEISERIVSHWEACLNCRACEAVCPSGVPYGRMMERTRAQVRSHQRQSPGMKRMTRWFLRAALPRPGLMRMGARLLRICQQLGVQAVVHRTGRLRIMPGILRQLESQLPRMSTRFFGPSRQSYLPDDGEPTMKVALLSGCVMPLMQGPTMGATVRTLTRNGCEVAVPPGQGCCGALNLHAGDLETGRAMARRNIDSFLASGADRIVTCSAGCGSTMKEYEELLKDDAEYAAKARQASEMTQDITEFLAELPFRPPDANLQRTVTYQDPCHLAHAQRISAAPRAILRGIPGVTLVEMENSSMCCGGAGVYAAVQPLLSQRILSRKLDAIAVTGADEVITANPGCMLQLEQGLRAAGQRKPVRHVVDILDEAYRLEADG
ncbi:MAG: 4Fe-4S dicluster domain-containing protein [Chloroflexi bacterium]|nr:4Fe-4S dicluster domain-containing protein [Chloroflexota bacterium]MYE40962.1 4Fe-4S dicluster domain-containing protein [Chloroflexota bacterium]